MVSRQNIDGRPRPTGVLKTVQDGPAAGLADPNEDLAVAGGDVGGVVGPRRGGRRRHRNGDEGRIRPARIAPPPDPGYIDGAAPPVEPPPVIQVPPSPPHADVPLPGGSRTGGGAGYRARTSQVAREPTEGQEQLSRESRFLRPGRTAPQSGARSQYGRRYGGGPEGTPRWEGSAGGGGYGTIPPPLPEPEPPPAEPPPAEPPPGPRGGRRGGRGGRGGGRRHHR